MIFVLLFVLAAISFGLLLWSNRPKIAVGIFVLTLVIASVYLLTEMASTLQIQL